MHYRQSTPTLIKVRERNCCVTPPSALCLSGMV
nr:MAG TPA: hypothetical protein [Caudoviricetes sp.]